jgi:arylsulfatase A-like enzyme
VKVRIGAAAALAVALAALWWWRPVDSRPNVLLVVWDTVRHDRLSLYGHRRPTTPRLDAWSRDAVVFEHARAPGIWTLPSHASMFTGLPASSTGADERWLWLDDAHETLAERFADRGYRTFSFAANALLTPETHLTQGFEVVMNTFRGRVRSAAAAATRKKLLPGDRSNELAPAWKPPDHGASNAEWARAVYKDAAPLVVDTFLRWVEERDDGRPFFAALNLMEAHTPRVPSARSRDALLDPATRALGLATDAAHIRLHFANFGKQTYSAEEIEAIRGVYDAALRDLDDATGALVDGLAAAARLDNTVIVLTSDHGENLADHGLFNHRFALWDSLLRVPLVVRFPRALPPGRVAEPVSTTDLFGTLAALCDLGPAPPTSHDWFAAGSRPGPVLSAMALPLEREIASVADVHPDVLAGPWLRTGTALALGSRVLTRYSTGETQGWDVATDPDQNHPLPPDPELVGLMDAALAALPPYDATRRTARDRPAHTRADRRDFSRALEALGYVAPEEPPTAAP